VSIHPSLRPPQFAGQLKGVELFVENGVYKYRQVTEDDGCWHRAKDYSDAAWLDDQIEQLMAAREWLKANATKGKWGCYYEAKAEV
jgi:hypothetical protein